MSDLKELDQYYKLADRLVDQSDKEQIAECARLLALNLAHYQRKYGEIPLEETLTILDSDMINDSQLRLLIDGMQNLIGVLGNVVSGLGENKH